MSDDSGTRPDLSPVAEGAVGAIVGTILGGLLYMLNIISGWGVLGAAVGVALGSMFNGWLRRNRENRLGK